MASHQLHQLTNEQMAAVDPASQIWLHASAGTGKTQVLTARVIRLLLTDDVRPEHLLCITFTKAGAAEMAERINGILARWVQMDDHLLFADLEALGAASGPPERAKARSLFADVLDAPSGGLQIQTIHSLAQSLLGSFPEEAGLIPGFNPVEGREQQELYSEALSGIVDDAERTGDQTLVANIQSLSIALGEDRAFKFLQDCAGEPDVLAGIPDDAGAQVFARHMAGVTFEGSVQAMLEAALADSAIDRDAIEAVAAQNLAWNAKEGSRGWQRATAIQEWLTLDPPRRAAEFPTLHHCWATGKGDPQVSSKGRTPLTESYAELALSQYQWTGALIEQVMLASYADRLAPALLAGKAFSARYTSAKKARGLVDFNDMIRKTAALLSQDGMGDWIRFKLDSRIDHILVDEAQDTNRAQWDIIEALSADFFAGLGSKDDRLRTIFSVGDEKQAIFGFQGTDPAEYNAARERFTARIAQADQSLLQLSLYRSYRSNWPVLEAVNAVFEEMPEKLGEIDAFDAHESGLSSDRSPESGTLELMLPVTTDLAAADDAENWRPDHKRILAGRIAARVKQLTDTAPILTSTGKPLRAGDIMILLRRRGDLASPLVAQLHDRDVAVAGIDRLKMQEPLVVQDMLSAVRFVLQPRDEYSLACLLVSPLFGWSQEKLLKYGHRTRGVDLWDHLRAQPHITDDLKPLHDLLKMADFTTAYTFLENLLSGDMAGRRKFASRLGQDALIPMEEMLNLALQFEQQSGGTLQAFLHWFESDETEIKREMLPDSDEVRVMTVHGAKGLQAPVVILADITADPEKKPDNSVSFKMDEGVLPMLNIRSAERFGKLAEIMDRQDAADEEEHLRLLYVAMTRAEEHLIMAGSLSDQRKETGEAPKQSWYPHLLRAMTQMGCAWQNDDFFGESMRFHVAPDKLTIAAPDDDDAQELTQNILKQSELPKWLVNPAPPESRPPRPLAPSLLDDDDYGEAPAASNMALAAEKGRILHMLFERISGIDVEDSLQKASRWLAGQSLPDGLSADDLLANAAPIVRNPEYAAWFGNDARAEVPLTAVVGETVISGRVDRLLVRSDRIELLDFKTGRSVADRADQVQPAFLKQMAHYVAALEVIFPDRTVEAAILYTNGPKLIQLPAGLLSKYKPAG